MKFGFDFTRLYYLNDPLGTPNYTFYNIWDFLNDAPEAEGGNFQATTGTSRRLPQRQPREHASASSFRTTGRLVPTLL
jgi:hypothetical protein